MSGCLDVWLSGWLANPPSWGSKIAQVGSKSDRLEAKILKIGSKKPLGGVLGALRVILAPRQLQEPKKSTTGPPPDPPGPHKLEPKIDQKSILRRCKRRSFFVSFFGSIFGAIWSQLVPILAPKTLPKWSQVGSKIDPRWSIDLGADF